MIEDPIVQLLVALGVSVGFMVVFREWKPFFEIESDTLFYVCGKGLLFSSHTRARKLGT